MSEMCLHCTPFSSLFPSSHCLSVEFHLMSDFCSIKWGLTIALNVFRCIARYGYKDARSEHEPFDVVLVPRLKEYMESSRALENGNDEGEVTVGGELELVEREWKNGVVHLLGENEVVAGRWSGPSGLWKKFVINCAYGILKRNIRQQDEVFTIPNGQLPKVGMTVQL